MFPAVPKTYAERSKQRRVPSDTGPTPSSSLCHAEQASFFDLSIAPLSPVGETQDSFSPVKPTRHERTAIKTALCPTTRTALRPLTNGSVIDEDINDSDRPAKRKGKREMPGTPRAESTSLNKSSRLFSPAGWKTRSPKRGGLPLFCTSSAKNTQLVSMPPSVSKPLGFVIGSDLPENPYGSDDDEVVQRSSQRKGCTSKQSKHRSAVKRSATDTDSRRPAGRRLLRSTIKSSATPATSWAGIKSQGTATPGTFHMSQQSAPDLLTTRSTIVGSRPRRSISDTTVNTRLLQPNTIHADIRDDAAIEAVGCDTAHDKENTTANLARTPIQALFSNLPLPDLEYLISELRSSGNTANTAWKFGFGKGFMLFLPTGWEVERRSRVGMVLLSLGFRREISRGKVCYKCGLAKLGELRREVAGWKDGRWVQKHGRNRQQSVQVNDHARVRSQQEASGMKRPEKEDKGPSAQQHSDTLQGLPTEFKRWRRDDDDGVEARMRIADEFESEQGSKEVPIQPIHIQVPKAPAEQGEDRDDMLITGGSASRSSSEDEDHVNRSGLSWSCLSIGSGVEKDGEGQEMEAMDNQSPTSAGSHSSFCLHGARKPMADDDIQEHNESRQGCFHETSACTSNIHHDGRVQAREQSNSDASGKQQDKLTRPTGEYAQRCDGTEEAGPCNSSIPSHEPALAVPEAPTELQQAETIESAVGQGVDISGLMAGRPSVELLIPGKVAAAGPLSCLLEQRRRSSQCMSFPMGGVGWGSGSGPGEAGRASSFATPLAMRPQADWGTSRPASEESVNRLLADFLATDPGVDTLGPPSARYSHNSPPPSISAVEPSRNSTVLPAASTALPGSSELPKSTAELDTEAKQKLKKHRSLQKKRRISIGLAMRRPSFMQSAQPCPQQQQLVTNQAHPQSSFAAAPKTRRSSRRVSKQGPNVMLLSPVAPPAMSPIHEEASPPVISSLSLQRASSIHERPFLLSQPLLTGPNVAKRRSRVSICTAMRGLSLLVLPSTRPSTAEPDEERLDSCPVVMEADEEGEGDDEDDDDGQDRRRRKALTVSEEARQARRTSSKSTSPLPKTPLFSVAGALTEEQTAAFLQFLPLLDLGAAAGVSAVCRAWSSATLQAQANILSDFDTCPPRHDCLVPWQQIAHSFPAGQFLSEGAYKSVYRVYCAEEQRVEALSLMDVKHIIKTGNTAILSQELRSSLLLSSLVRDGICPHHVETYGVLRTTYAPRDIWGCDDRAFAKRQGLPPHLPTSSEHADYQLIRMELCNYGDLEGYLKRQPGTVLCLATTQQLIFQMLFALYSAREAYDMRHYDIKLLNFLVSDGLSPAQRSHRAETSKMEQHQRHARAKPGTEPGLDQQATVRYGLGPHLYSLEQPGDHAICIKLADFGTAALDTESFGQPVGMDHFTTLENTPIDFLTDGDLATQGYGADAFSLGLAIWHLFTGEKPYEEIMEDVQCPPELLDGLRKVWTGCGYLTIARVLEAQGVDEDDTSQEQLDPTLFHTFYRYLVLLGIPACAQNAATTTRRGKSKKGKGPTHEEAQDPGKPLWTVIRSLIGPASELQRQVSDTALKPLTNIANNTTRGGRRAAAPTTISVSKGQIKKRTTKREKVTRQYWEDVKQFGMMEGKHWLIARGRERMQALPGAIELVRSLLDFRPENRPSMYEAIGSQLFLSLRTDAGPNGRSEAATQKYLAYYRPERLAGAQIGQQDYLPIRTDI